METPRSQIWLATEERWGSARGGWIDERVVIRTSTPEGNPETVLGVHGGTGVSPGLRSAKHLGGLWFPNNFILESPRRSIN